MKIYIIIFILTASLSFLTIQTVNAETKVTISNNGEGATSKVEVNNSAGTSNTSTSTSNSKTHIRIETNGQVKEYSSDKPEDISIQSEDGTAKVRVNNSVLGSTNISTTPAEIEKKINEQKEEIKKELEEKKEELKKKLEDEKKKIEENKFDLLEFFNRIFSFDWF